MMLTRTAIKFGLALGIGTYAIMNSVTVEAAGQTRVFLNYQYLDSVRSSNVRRPQVGRPTQNTPTFQPPGQRIRPQVGGPRYDMRMTTGMSRKGGSTNRGSGYGNDLANPIYGNAGNNLN